MSKKLIAYFSVSGNTKIIAGRLRSITGADMFEIRPEVPYSKADVNWTNPVSRCNREKIGKKDVKIEGGMENLSGYDVIYLGFPIWYYGAPNIIQTFLKQNDFSGKKIAIFATSGGSAIGKTAQKLLPYLEESAEIVDARVFSPKDDIKTLEKWAVF